MSFLENIKLKRNLLKPTATTIQQADGTRTMMQNGIITQLTSAHGYVVDTKPDTVATCILEEFLFLGSQDSVDLVNIADLGISHVLSVGIEMPNIGSHTGVTNLFITCLDLPETDLLLILDKCNEFLVSAKERGGRVLVHCNAGVSRSTSVVIGYLMLVNGMSFSDAYCLVKLKRSCCRPNDGFLKQLQQINQLR